MATQLSKRGTYLRPVSAAELPTRIGILFQNDDYGKDYVKGLKDGLNGKIRIVAASPYEATDATIDSQIVGLQSLGADVLYPTFRTLPAGNHVV